MSPGPDDDISIAVAIHIPGAGQRVAKLIPGADAFFAPLVSFAGNVAPAVEGVGFAVKVGVFGTAEDDVGVAIAVHVARAGHRRGVVRVTRIETDRPAWVIRQTAGPAPVQIGQRLAAAYVRGTNDHVGIAIAVHVAGAGHRFAKTAIVYGPCLKPVPGSFVQAVGTAVIDIGRAAFRSALVLGSHDHIGIAVTVHVPRPGHRRAEPIFRSCSDPFPIPRVADAAAAPMVYIGRARLGASNLVVANSAHDDVGVAVPVHVARARHRVAKPVLSRFTGEGPIGRRIRPVSAAMVNIDFARVRTEPPVSDDNVGIPVAVDIPRPGDRIAERMAATFTVERDKRAETQAGSRTQKEIGPPGSGMAGGTDEDIIIAVAVDVPSASHRKAKGVIVAFANLAPVR